MKSNENLIETRVWLWYSISGTNQNSELKLNREDCMEYNLKKHIDFLLKNACPSIRYLVHRNMLKAPADEPFMMELQIEILQQSNVQKHLSAQNPDGWFGHELHGTDGMDCHIKGLLELGFETSSPYIQKAITALTTPGIASQHKNWFHGGEALDADGRGGNRAVSAGILSWVKYHEDYPLLFDEISLAFEHLSAVLDYTSVDDFSVKGKNKRYYKPNALFPGANHIGLLENTQSWRNEENMKTAKNAAKCAYNLLKDFDGHITFRKPKEYGSGVVGPFNYDWMALSPVNKNGFQNILDDPYHLHFGFWLRTITAVPGWVRQTTQPYEFLAQLLDEDTFMDMIPGKTLKGFKDILGREPNWRKKASIKCDVAFALLNACWPVINP